MAVLKMNVKDIDQYWERLSNSLQYFFRYLQGKAEYGSHVSESGIQRTVLFTAETIARERNMNVNMVSSLCKAVALCFPKKGFAELSVIKEYIKRNHLDIALDTLEIDAIEYEIYRSGATVAPELDLILHKYYSDDESVPEVDLVRFLQKYLNLHRERLCECSFSESGQVVNAIMKSAKAEYETSYRLLPDPMVQSIPQNVKKEIEENLQVFINFYQDDITAGVYEVIVC